MIAALYSAKDCGLLTEVYLTSDQCHILEQGNRVELEDWVPSLACRVSFYVYLAHVHQAVGGSKLVLFSEDYPRTKGQVPFVEYIRKGRLGDLLEAYIS